MPSDEVLIPTPAAEWGKPGFVVRLPSNRVARLTRSQVIFTMIRDNNLPNPLAAIVSKMIGSYQSGNMNNMSEEDMVSELGPESVPVLLKFVDDVVLECMVEPRCERPYVADFREEDEQHNQAELLRQSQWEPSLGSISLELISNEDKAYIFKVALGGAADLEAFRAQSQAVVVAPQHGTDLLGDAINAAGRKAAAIKSPTASKKVAPGDRKPSTRRRG